MKKIRDTGITGQKGVTLVQRIVLDMGSIWHATGGLEAGTDGFIEFRDPTTDEVLNVHLPVQSRATTKPFSSETETNFTYVCDPEDLEYWLKGNKPIILVRSRPDTNEAYWVSLKDYFRDPEKRKTRKIVFDKNADRFEPTALHRLLGVATSNTGGTYLAPPPKPERILSNLLRISRLPASLFHAQTDCGDGRAIRERLNAAGAQVDEWVVRRHQVLSVHNLAEEPWRRICDLGTVEEFDVEDWANTTDDDRSRDFVELLNYCLRARLRAYRVRYDRAEKYFHFTARPDLQPRVVAYRSLTRDSKRPVVRPYVSTKDSSVITYHRHHAFFPRFRRLRDSWYLQIDPTYRFTSDGFAVSPLSPKLLAGMRKLERNPAVLGQVIMWASILSDSETPELFAEPAYSHLGFDRLLEFESPVGIEDASWITSDDDPDVQQALAQAQDELALFETSESPATESA